MGTYKEIHGTQIEIVSSNPSNPVEGQVWYNTTDSKLRGNKITTAGSWSTLTSLNTARDQIAGAGSTTSALVFGENFGGETELWNGSTWTEKNDLNTSRRALAGAGASGTASLAFGGNLHHGGPNAAADETENFNGTSWTEVADLNQARSFPGGIGTNTAALSFGGSTGAGTNPPITAENESWNGTSWTEQEI